MQRHRVARQCFSLVVAQLAAPVLIIRLCSFHAVALEWAARESETHPLQHSATHP
jgi:hypothetical protein